MTKEQIAELQGLRHMCRGSLPPCECDIPEALGDEGGRDAPLPFLQRLLDEREALLEGAKYLVENYPERQATRYMLALKAAIAKAEAPRLGQNGAEPALAAPRRPPDSLEGE